MKKIWMIGMAMLALAGCYYDNEEELYPNSGANTPVTGAVSYSTTIKPIMEPNCTNSCHNQGNPSGGYRLDGYENLNTYLNLPANKFVCAIEWTCNLNMPSGGNKLSQGQINNLKAWIAQGHPNN